MIMVTVVRIQNAIALGNVTGQWLWTNSMFAAKVLRETARTHVVGIIHGVQMADVASRNTKTAREYVMETHSSAVTESAILVKRLTSTERAALLTIRGIGENIFKIVGVYVLYIHHTRLMGLAHAAIMTR